MCKYWVFEGARCKKKEQIPARRKKKRNGAWECGKLAWKG